MPTILLTNQYAPALQELIRAEVPQGFDIIMLEKTTKADVVAHAPKADYLLVGGRLAIDAEVIDVAKRLRMVQRTGVGLDAMDLDLLKERGIPVYVNPGVNARSVAEHTLMLMLSVLRRAPAVNATLHAGIWKKHELGILNRDLHGRKVGLLGLGHIGKHVAAMLQAFGAEVYYHKPERLSAAEEQRLGVTYLELEELIRTAEVLSLHCPLTPATRGLLNADRIAGMRPGAFLINTARGPIVDEAALVDALRSGHLAGAGLDVFATEPLPADSALIGLPNAMLSPHISGITRDSFGEMMRQGFRNIAAFERGDLQAIAPMELI